MEETIAVAPALQIPGWQVHTFDQVASTMDEAHRLAAQGAPEKTLVWAARQALGRGRQGRAWVSPEGGAYCSLILRPSRSIAEAPQLALVAGLAAAETLRDVACLYPSIRWPNDLLIKGRKLGGILAEAKREKCQTPYVVLGIGIKGPQHRFNEHFPVEFFFGQPKLDIENIVGDIPCKIFMLFPEFADRTAGL